MAITRGSFTADDGPKPSSKHFVPPAGQGPQFTGKYSDVVPNAAASQSSADDAAADIYGSPGDATRMSRMTNIAKEAFSSDGVPGSADGSEAFIDGSTASTWKDASGNDGDDMAGFGPNDPNYPQAANVPGAPGFPGNDDDYYPLAEAIQPTKPAIKASKAVTAVSDKSNNPAVAGYPGFPGIDQGY